MTTILPTSEEDPALSVVRFTSELSWADAGPEVAEPQVSRLCTEAQECMVRARWFDLVSLMLTSADVILSKVSEKDLECIFTVICNVVTKSESPDEALEMAKLISAKITQQPSDKPALRLKILFNLYNLLENPYSRLAKESFKFLSKYLATFSGEDAYILSEAKEEAVRTIVEFVKAPDLFQCDLLDMPAVGQLEKDAKHALAYQLLQIFLTQRLDAYVEFQDANSTLLKGYGLVHEDCMTKMRLISLVDLGSDDSGRIPYSLIRDTLQINDEKVELWVVKAITAKLMDCKMDQMNQMVIVSRCTERVFEHQQWLTLRSKLATWRGNVANVISTIRANRIAEDGSQAVQGLVIR
ncbi:eukaryotic translation initiation factor 3 subunit M-like [Prunus yedoensis var. nudiflora]|uniref:Eukaryotic translation initiation factor 3 subunit M-like n=1 Tax=Prunus yedoensis var. nudiflora TaxID=2094558 RepID=A0A314YZQ9_PRUYE|nr:eukaryotic translation initiation factor 3 subunit M-like [Prunus yedoensis var. nudiflora]